MGAPRFPDKVAAEGEPGATAAGWLPGTCGEVAHRSCGFSSLLKGLGQISVLTLRNLNLSVFLFHTPQHP